MPRSKHSSHGDMKTGKMKSFWNETYNLTSVGHTNVRRYCTLEGKRHRQLSVFFYTQTPRKTSGSARARAQPREGASSRQFMCQNHTTHSNNASRSTRGLISCDRSCLGLLQMKCTWAVDAKLQDLGVKQGSSWVHCTRFEEHNRPFVVVAENIHTSNR